MIETAAALSAGLGVLAAILAVGAPAPVVPAWLWRALARWWSRQLSLSAGTGWAWLDGPTLVAGECCAALAAAVTATAMTGLVVRPFPQRPVARERVGQ